MGMDTGAVQCPGYAVLTSEMNSWIKAGAVDVLRIQVGELNASNARWHSSNTEALSLCIQYDNETYC